MVEVEVVELVEEGLWRRASKRSFKSRSEQSGELTGSATPLA
jgi:hypothetical protein